jgi:hypothetical protein
MTMIRMTPRMPEGPYPQPRLYGQDGKPPIRRMTRMMSMMVPRPMSRLPYRPMRLRRRATASPQSSLAAQPVNATPGAEFRGSPSRAIEEMDAGKIKPATSRGSCRGLVMHGGRLGGDQALGSCRQGTHVRKLWFPARSKSSQCPSAHTIESRFCRTGQEYRHDRRNV